MAPRNRCRRHATSRFGKFCEFCVLVKLEEVDQSFTAKDLGRGVIDTCSTGSISVLRWVRSRNVYRPRTGGDRRDRWRMLMKRLLLYTTTGCGGSERLATSNPPSYRVIFLPNTNPNCSVTSVLFERRALLFRSHARDTVYTCSRI